MISKKHTVEVVVHHEFCPSSMLSLERKEAITCDWADAQIGKRFMKIFPQPFAHSTRPELTLDRVKQSVGSVMNMCMRLP